MRERIYIYDTTLRDGAQTEGISYSLKDKIYIAKKLGEFGVDFIEGGWPFSNPKDNEFFAYFKKKPLRKTKIVPFGSTAHPSSPPHKDKNLLSLIRADTEYVTIFGKSWDLHVKEVLKISLQENLDIIYKSVDYLKKRGKKVFYDAEHFFDGYKNNPQYALSTLKAASSAGAELIIFCDTNGGALPGEVSRILDEVKEKAGITSWGIHCHNDSGLAVANSIVGVDKGVVQIQGTINGYGERCGNTNLITVVGILALKMNKELTCSKNIKKLVEISRFVSEVSNMVHQDNYPFVGRSAFAHKGGVHIDAMIKNPLCYEHISPSAVGNRRRFLISELAGKSSLVTKAKELDIEIDKKSPRTKKLHRLLQERESQGYQFESAEGSLRVLIERVLRPYKKMFDLSGFRVIVEKRDDGRLISEATVKVKVEGKTQHTAGEGDGPVNALDNALRKALSSFYPDLADMHLTDFKVRVLDAKEGTAAKVRVLIESQDKETSWVSVGVSENIIEASYQALVDSIEYKLLKDAKKK